MSKQNMERALRRELENINDKIDAKIIRGLSYVQESRRHKFIVNSLNNIKKTRVSSNWFGKTFIFG